MSTDNFEDMGVTPELTQAMRDLSTVNVGIIQLKKLKESGMAGPEVDDLLYKLESVMVPMLVDQMNAMIKREEILKRGL